MSPIRNRNSPLKNFGIWNLGQLKEKKVRRTKEKILQSQLLSLSARSSSNASSTCNAQTTHTQLLEASATGDVVGVTNALHNGADIEMKDSTGLTPIGIAVKKNAVRIIRLLLDKNASIDASFAAHPEGSLLTLAIESNASDAAQFLLSNLGPTWSSKQLETALNLEVENLAVESRAIMITVAINLAASVDAIEAVKNLLEAGAPVRNLDHLQRNLLMTAAKYDSSKTLQYLLQHRDFLKLELEEKDLMGSTALIHAVNAGNLTAMKILLKAGVNFIYTAGLRKNLLMHAVSCTDRQQVLDHLIEYNEMFQISIDAQTPEGWTALMFAVQEDNFEAVKRLSTAGANPSCQNDAHQNILMIAAGHGSMQVLKYLLARKEKFQINLEAQNINHETALHHAISGDCLEAMQVLLDAGAISSHPEYGSPLTFATFSESMKILRHLLTQMKESKLEISKDEQQMISKWARGRPKLIGLFAEFGVVV